MAKDIWHETRTSLHVRNLDGHEKQALWTECTHFYRGAVRQCELTGEELNNAGDYAKFQINNHWVWVTHCSLNYSKNQDKHFGSRYNVGHKHFSPPVIRSFILCKLFCDFKITLEMNLPVFWGRGWESRVLLHCFYASVLTT